MKYSVLTNLVLICTFVVTRVCCAPIDDQIITTTLSPSSLTLTSEKEKLLADEIGVPKENKEVGNEGSISADINPDDDKTTTLSETTARIVLEEDIAFFMPKTTISTLISPEIITTTTTSTDDINADSTTISILEEDQATTITPTTTTLSTTTIKQNLKPIIVKELSSVEFFTPGKPFVLICKAENPSTTEVFFTKPIKYSWNKNGRPFDELNDPSRKIYSESSNNGNILFVVPKSPDDEGTYQCVAENKFGKSYSRGSIVMGRRRGGSPRAIVNVDISPIEGEPVIEVVPENVPDFGLNRDPKLVFIVFPSVREETEVEVINMTSAANDQDQTEDAEKIELVNDVKELLDPLLNTDTTDESSHITAEKEKVLNVVKNLVQGLLEESNVKDEGVEGSENVSDKETLVEEVQNLLEGSGDDGSSLESSIDELLNSDASDDLELRRA